MRRTTTAPNACYTLALLFGLAACQLAHSASASSSSSVTHPVDVARSGAVARALSDTDSTVVQVPPDTDQFEAIGYLLPDSTLQIGKYIFDDIALSAPAGISLRTTTDVWRFYKCPGATVTRDTLDLSCPGTPVGTIVVKWKRTNDSDELLQHITAMVSVRRNGRVVLLRRVRLHWWEGECGSGLTSA
jgi:hypothetical protein